MELTPLRYFREIARARHLTRAAQSLGVTQPALSAVVKKLEKEVGTPLLDRTGRGVELTEAGRIFLAHAEESLAAAERGVGAVRQLLGLERGSIRVGGGATATTCLLPPVVSYFRKAHPGVRFYVREAGSSAVAAAVLSGELDLGIVTLPIEVAGAASLVRVPLVEDELRLVGLRRDDSKGASSKGAKPSDSERTFRWRDVQDEPFVAFEAGTAVRDLVDRSARRAGVTLNVVMELRSIESIQSMVKAGIGVGLVSRFSLAGETGFGEGLACRDGRLTRTLAIIRRRDREPGAAAGAFERALLDRFRPEAARRRKNK
ncbi:MAG: LysR family transcriptional regulator [Phycisphaerales bacterium]|nr:MAG: LysR family transcriptional regulator [Phycisphaerales bacterium]